MHAPKKSAAPGRGVLSILVLPQVALIAATLLWGGNFVAGKALAGDVPPTAISFLRWSVALLVLLPLGFGEVRRHRALLLAHWRLIAAVGATGIAGYTLCFYQALAATTAINALLFVSTAPLLITLANWCVFRDRVTPWQVLGTVVSSLGAVVIIAHGDATLLLALRFNRGDLWMVAGVLVWVAYSLLLRRRPSALPPQPFFTASALAGTALLAPLYCWQFAHGERLALTGPVAVGVLYVALGVSALGYACWTRGVAAVGPDRAGTFLHLIPVFGTMMAIIFLGERLAPYHLSGAAMVAAGIGLASLRQAPAPPTARRATAQACAELPGMRLSYGARAPPHRRCPALGHRLLPQFQERPPRVCGGAVPFCVDPCGVGYRDLGYRNECGVIGRFARWSTTMWTNDTELLAKARQEDLRREAAAAHLIASLPSRPRRSLIAQARCLLARWRVPTTVVCKAKPGCKCANLT